MSTSTFMMGINNAAGGGAMVVLDGHSSNHFDFAVLCVAGFTFNLDGSIDDQGPGNLDLSQVDPGTWWSDEPDAIIGNSYDVRCASLVSGTWSVQAATVGTWIQMSANRNWRSRVIGMSSPDIRSCNGIFEVRATGVGVALDSAQYNTFAEN